MTTKRYTPCSLGRNTIGLGKQGEANALRIEFDCGEWLNGYPTGAVKLLVFPPGEEEPLVPVLGREGDVRVWIVGEDETRKAGNGMIELIMEDETTGARIKSATGYTVVRHSPSAGRESAGQAGYVRYDTEQALTDEEKAQARQNIGASTGSADPDQIKDAVNDYLEEHPVTGMPDVTEADEGKVMTVVGGKWAAAKPPESGVDFEVDEKTLKFEDGVLSVNTTDRVEEDNTQPVTSAAVYTEVGNINALLETI